MATQEFIKHANDGSFMTMVIKAEKPTLVDFWAPWCGPCRAIAPVLEEIAEAYGDKINVVKVNVDESPQTASHYHVQSIPTLQLFKGGEIRETKIGMMKKDQLSAFIDRHL